MRNANDNSQRQGGLPLGFRLAQPAALHMTDTCTAVITHYDGEDFGIVRTNSQGNGIFHVNAVFLCGSHRLMCKDAECPNYERYDPAKRQQLMENLLPVGTQVNMLRRAVKNEKFAFQGKLVWPQLSKKPMEKDGVTPELSDKDLNVHLMNLKMRYKNSSSVAIQEARRRQQQQFVEPLPYKNRVDDPDRAPSSPTPPPAPIEPPKRCPLYTEDDPDEYIGKLDKIDHHFKNAFAFTLRTDLVFYQLCTGIMKFRGGNAAILGSSRLAILKFCKDNEVEVTQEKMADIMANFTVLFHQLSSGKKAMNASSLARPAPKFEVDIGTFAQLNALNEQNRKKKMEKEAREKRETQLRLVEAEKRKREASGSNSTCTGRSRDTTPSPRPSAASTPSLSEEFIPPEMPDTDSVQNVSKAATEHEKQSEPSSLPETAVKPTYSLPSSASSSLAIEPKFSTVSVKSLSSFEEEHNHDPYASIHIKGKQIKPYFSLTNWLEKCFAPTNDTPQHEHTMSLARAVVKTLPENDGKKTFADLKMTIRRGLMTAPDLFSKWLTDYEKQWKFNEGEGPNVAVETIVAAVFSYCWSEIFSDNHISIRNLILGVTVKTDDNNIYRDQGLIIHYFDNNFGVIQTRHGKVIFDSNVAMRHAYEMSGAGSSALKWTRCKTDDRLPVGALVRLNSRVGSFKNNNLIEFRFATKVWSAVGYEQPDISIDIAGGLVYWAEVMSVLESIVKANSVLSSPCDDDPAFTKSEGQLYDKYFDAIIQQRYRKGSLPESYDSKKWKSFSNFLTFAQFGKDGAEKHEKTTATVHLLVSLGVSLYDLRKDYLSKALIESKDLFVMTLEQILLNPGNLDVSVPRPDQLCNIAPRIHEYFHTEDGLASAQLVEAKKIIENNGGSPESPGHVKEVVSAVHQYYWKDLEHMFADNADRMCSSPTSTATAGNGTVGAAEVNEGASASPSSAPTATASATHSSVENSQTSSSSSSSGYSTYPNPPGITAEEPCAEVDNLSSRRTSPGCESGRNSSASQGEMDSHVAVSQAEFDELKERFAALERRNSALERWKEEYLEAQEVYKLDVVTVMKEMGNRINELQEGLTSRNNEVVAAATIAAAAAGATASPTTVIRATADKCNVQIADNNSKEIYQFSTNEDGDLSVSAVTAIIPGTNCLKFKDAATGVTTVCRQVGDVFEVPEGGWGDRTYDANVPPPPPPVSSSNGTTHVNFPIGGIGGKLPKITQLPSFTFTNDSSLLLQPPVFLAQILLPRNCKPTCRLICKHRPNRIKGYSFPASNSEVVSAIEEMPSGIWTLWYRNVYTQTGR